MFIMFIYLDLTYKEGAFIPYIEGGEGRHSLPPASTTSGDRGEHREMDKDLC